MIVKDTRSENGQNLLFILEMLKCIALHTWPRLQGNVVVINSPVWPHSFFFVLGMRVRLGHFPRLMGEDGPLAGADAAVASDGIPRQCSLLGNADL
ncbi:hypothetical protein NPIL_346101 [Nephila pilipes]|uniref:Uncharacterized protein n=1 Tax=Nephila pilipes TaxID=299642 RepID=A0A8X6UBN3_NEPPI|nr:hypothetical protein NPIL_346101 [Nephila pilipes]